MERAWQEESYERVLTRIAKLISPARFNPRIISLYFTTDNCNQNYERLQIYVYLFYYVYLYLLLKFKMFDFILHFTSSVNKIKLKT